MRILPKNGFELITKDTKKGNNLFKISSTDIELFFGRVAWFYGIYLTNVNESNIETVEKIQDITDEIMIEEIEKE